VSISLPLEVLWSLESKYHWYNAKNELSLIYCFSHVSSTSSRTHRAAIARYHKNEPDLALSAALKYLAVTISLHGFDSAEALNAHLTLADILLGSGKPEGVRHVRAAHFLMEFMAGTNYAGITSQYYRMGSHCYDSGDLEGALRCYEAAAAKRSEDRMFDCLIARHSAGILARLGRFKQSFDYEKKAYQLYVTFLGDEHEATKACSATLMVSLIENTWQNSTQNCQQSSKLFAASHEARCRTGENV
jgi:tetratricopeptide (TPR) repeat protein